ncbi:MAG: hypothetical protein R3E14_13695 [Erythrobacter sp.]
MKYTILLAATVALAACGSKEEAPVEPVETADTTMEATATGDMAGVYEVKMADGTVVRETINSDGTYVDATLEGAETERGTWRQDGDKMCFDPEGDAPEACFAGGAPGEDGTFEVRDADGNVASTVRKISDAAAPE